MTATAHRRLVRHLVVATVSMLVAISCGGGSGSDESARESTRTPTPTVDDRPGTDPTPTSSPTPAETSAPQPPDESPTPTEPPDADPTPAPTLIITSSAFGDGEEIPIRYTCDGANVLPPLEFSNVPDGTVTLALVLDDPDAPGGTFDHWVRFDIDPVDGVDEGAASTALVGAIGTAGTNDFGNLLYGGPCPPDGTHRYVFRLFAVDGDLGLPEGATAADLDAALEGRVLGSAELVGVYERLAAQPPAPGLDPTPLIGRVASAYKVSPSGERVAYTFEELPFEPGTVEAHWYVSDDRYVVVYRGIDTTAIGPLCPGNSIETAGGFAHVSNAPSGVGGCGDAVAPPPEGVGVADCGTHLVYVTAIPTTESGNLYGTIEAFDDGDALLGVTSAVPTSFGAAPTIDLDAFCSS